MSQSKCADSKRARGGTGNFFIVDRRLWKEVCDAGDVNSSAAWLLLMQGTGGNQRTTAWSVDSIKRYLGMGYPRAKAAINKLLALGFIRHGEKHSPQKPRYDLLTFAERVALAKCTRSKGWKELHASAEEDADYNLIWLPNEVVTGTVKGEKSPIHKLRATGDPWALRLFIDLYHEHNLRDDGGVSRTFLWEEYKAVILGERGPYRILGFKSDAKQHNGNGPLLIHESRPNPCPDDPDWSPGWESLSILEQTGVLTFVPHLLENATEHAEVIHAFGIGGHSEHPMETRIGEEARLAAAKMCHPWQLEKAGHEGLMICPVSRDYPNAQLVGIARLHYRAHTKRTSAWESNLLSAGPDCAEHFRRLAAEYSAEKQEVFA